jgi:hypothetical protein
MKVIALNEGRPRLFGKQLRHRGFAAAGHSHENQDNRTCCSFVVQMLFIFGNSFKSATI